MVSKYTSSNSSLKVFQTSTRRHGHKSGIFSPLLSCRQTTHHHNRHHLSGYNNLTTHNQQTSAHVLLSSSSTLVLPLLNQKIIASNQHCTLYNISFARSMGIRNHATATAEYREQMGIKCSPYSLNSNIRNATGR